LHLFLLSSRWFFILASEALQVAYSLVGFAHLRSFHFVQTKPRLLTPHWLSQRRGERLKSIVKLLYLLIGARLKIRAGQIFEERLVALIYESVHDMDNIFAQLAEEDLSVIFGLADVNRASTGIGCSQKVNHLTFDDIFRASAMWHCNGMISFLGDNFAIDFR
jgi:hypothetical protein